MFESAELGHQIDKERYEAEVPELRTALLAAQYEVVKNKTFSVVILIAGVDGGGKGDTRRSRGGQRRVVYRSESCPAVSGLEDAQPVNACIRSRRIRKHD